jgi:dimethylglycine dehydrogenase
MEVHGTTDADALGNNPIYGGDDLVGRATGGNYGFRIGKSLALGMVRPELAAVGTELRMNILGTDHEVTIIPESPYDPKNQKLRA